MIRNILDPDAHNANRGKILCRFKMLKRVESSSLHLSVLREYGLKSSMQGPLKVSGELLDYIESFFQK